MRVTWFACVLLALGAVTLRAAAPSVPPTPFGPMDRMRMLAGEWAGRVKDAPEGPMPASVSYEVVSGGYAILERLKMGDSDPMVTMYHQEGEQLMMTHYCSSNTQPRLRTRAIPRNFTELQFEFVDSTNILNASMMNIHSFKLVFTGPDTIVQVWKSHDPKEKAAVIEFRRKR
jgi:hypothetical protein